MSRHSRHGKLSGKRRWELLPTFFEGMSLSNSEPEELIRRGLSFHQSGRLLEAQQCYQEVLEQDPRNVDASHLLGILKAARGEGAEALRLIQVAVHGAPNSPMILLNYGNALSAAGRPEEGLGIYDRALAIQPNNHAAWFNRGNTLRLLGRPLEALASFDRVIALEPSHVAAHYIRGNVLSELKRLDEALMSFDRAIALKPGYVEAHHGRGSILGDLGRFDEALENFDRALSFRVDADMIGKRGMALRALGRVDEALASFDKAIAIKPDCVEAYNNRGLVLAHLKRLDEALASYDRAVELKRDSAQAHYNRGDVLVELKRLDEALASFDKAISLKPDYFEAHNNRGNVLRSLKRTEEALGSYELALSFNPGLVEALHNCGNALNDLGRYEQAFDHFERALSAQPEHRYALDGLAKAALNACKWSAVRVLQSQLELHIREARSIINPFTLLGYYDRADLQLACTKAYVADRLPSVPTAPRLRTARYRPKIRIAYMSSDFRVHAVSLLLAEIFELHDRSRFDVIGVSWGADDGSALRARLRKGFDEFMEIAPMSDHDVAQRMRDSEVDIAIDLNGLTNNNRIEIFALRAAPIQVNYLGCPATMGCDFIDYVLSDPTVLPWSQQQYWAERIVHLPYCYQPNDGARAYPLQSMTRREVGLPESGFVFCCFNSIWKINATMFDIWMRLLHDVPGSVLWLLGDNESAKRNLRREAEARGIKPDRLVFAPRVNPELHWARHRLADIYLDTLPCNAHTTASDALWMGVPLVTCPGQSFAARGGASLLQAVGLPDLICSSLLDYETAARRLATGPSMLRSIKARLEANRSSSRLFDSPRLCRDLEEAYSTMWDIYQRGDSPRAFTVGNPAGARERP